MCYHISNKKENPKQLETRFDASFEFKEVYEPYHHFNGFEKRYLYIIPQESPRTILPSYWGIMPATVDISKRSQFLTKTNTLNATYERLYSSPLYKNHITNNRCLIIADGLYEPHKSNSVKGSIPYYFQMKDRSLFAFAGIYNELDDDLFTASIITVEANPLFKEIHNSPNKKGSYRMPLILDEKDEMNWLNSDLKKNDVEQLLFTFTSKEIEAYPVSQDLFKRSVDSNVPGITNPVNYSSGETLFGSDF